MRGLRFVQCLVTSLITLLLSGCLETSLVYNPNMHQTGRTAGRGKVRVHLNGGLAQQIYTSVEDRKVVSRVSEQGLNGSPGLAIALSGHVDLGGSVEIGSAASGNCIGGRFYLKDMLTDSQSAWAFSVMPAIAFLDGPTGNNESTGSTLSSSLVAFELHAPVSYHVGRYFAVFAEPQLMAVSVAAPFKAGAREDIHFPNQTMHKTWLGAGVGLGIKEGPFVPEISLFYMNDIWRTLGGISFTF